MSSNRRLCTLLPDSCPTSSLCVPNSVIGLGSTGSTVDILIRRYEHLIADSSSQFHAKPVVAPSQIHKESLCSQISGSAVGNGRQPGKTKHQERWENLLTSLGSLIRDAVALFAVDCFVTQGQGQPDYNYYQAVENFTLHYQNILSGSYFPQCLEELDLDTMENTYHVLSFFCTAYLDGHGQRTTTTREATFTERQRILRAFYRRDIFMRLYYAGGTDRDYADREAYLKDFYNRKLGQVLTRAWAREDIRVFNGRLLYLFEPWELEQIVSADFFLAQSVYDHMQLREQCQSYFSQAQRDEWRSSPSAMFCSGPISRLHCDLGFLRRAESGLENALRTWRAQNTLQGPRRSLKLGHCLLFAPYFFLFEQQAISHRNGYNRLQQNGHLLPPFEEETVDNIPFAWFDAFAGRSPQCHAFGIALAPIEHKYKQFRDDDEFQKQIYPYSTSETFAYNELTAHAATQPTITKSTGVQSFDVRTKWRLWANWCDLGFVMWDRDHVEELKADTLVQSPKLTFEHGWINAEALLDTMANARLTKQAKRIRYPAWMVGYPIAHNGASAVCERRTLKTTPDEQKERTEWGKHVIKRWEEAKKKTETGAAG